MTVGELLNYIKKEHTLMDTIITVSDAEGNNPCEAEDSSYLIDDCAFEDFDEGSLYLWGR